MNDAVAALSARKLRDQQIKANTQNLAKIFQARLDSQVQPLKTETIMTTVIATETQVVEKISINVEPQKADEVTAEATNPANETQAAKQPCLEKKQPIKRRKLAMKKNVETAAFNEEIPERIIIRHELNIYFMKTQDIEEKCVWLLTEAQREKAFRIIPRVGLWIMMRTVLNKLKSLQAGGYICDEVARIFPFSGPTGYNGIIITIETKKALEEMNLPGLYGYFK